MHDRLKVIRIERLPASLRVDVTSPVEREARAYFYRRGCYDEHLAVARVNSTQDCYYTVDIPAVVAKWPPGRYEMQIKTSAYDVAHAVELVFGTKLEVAGVATMNDCGGCCV
jgi:hypothetical protein